MRRNIFEVTEDEKEWGCVWGGVWRQRDKPSVIGQESPVLNSVSCDTRMEGRGKVTEEAQSRRMGFECRWGRQRARASDGRGRCSRHRARPPDVSNLCNAVSAGIIYLV